MTSGLFTGNLLRGLAARVLFFLSLALLPIGLIAIAQTREIAKQDRESAELSLLAVTEQATMAERQLFQEAFGAADALALIARLKSSQPEDCSDFFRAYRASTDLYGLVGFIALDGMMSCSSSPDPLDFSADDAFKQNLEKPGRLASRRDVGPVTGLPVALITAPVFDEGRLDGFIALTIPLSAFSEVEEPEPRWEPITLFTFNPKARLLTAETDFELARTEAPSTVSLAALSGQKSAVFHALNSNGEPRIYALQPLVTNAAYAISVWPEDAPFLVPDLTTRLGALLPILMWAASLVVAFWALNRLALRHIRKLGRQMRRFALNRHLPSVAMGSTVPSELREMESAFISMGESILRDEAQLEDSLREKNILLKEVHHRVKNNLQLISSIMNMQIRQAKTEDASRVLRRLQERILSLATVHKNLYQNDDLVQVNARTLLDEVVNQLLTVGIEPGSNVQVTQSYDDVTLDTDDAAPLTLLVSEAVTNAIKNLPASKQGQSRLEISLSEQKETHHARLSVVNTIGGQPVEDGTGLGNRLIQAFARQLNGTIEIDEEDGHYRLTVIFPLPQSTKQVYDY